METTKASDYPETDESSIRVEKAKWNILLTAA